MNAKDIPALLLRIGLAFSLLYAAISSFITPSSWIAFLPTFLKFTAILHIFSIIEIILALWLLSGKKLFYGAGLTSLALFGIVIANIGSLDIIFRDITILLAALALTYIGYNKKK